MMTRTRKGKPTAVLLVQMPQWDGQSEGDAPPDVKNVTSELKMVSEIEAGRGIS